MRAKRRVSPSSQRLGNPMSSWFLVPQPRPAAQLKLFCVPHAGRGASLYMPWRAFLPESMELNSVQLPGREGRLAEAPLRRVSAMAEGLAQHILPRLDRPYVLFGHSMGALICFEAARVLRRLGAPLPQALVLSGRRAPTVPDRGPPIHGLSDAEFVDAICARYNGIPQIILEQPEMMRMFLPIIRADLEAIETYTYLQETPLDVPFFLYGGRDDEQVAPENIAGWRMLTEARSEQRLFTGGHFYLQGERDALIQALITDLSPFVSERPSISAGARSPL
jgi:medium-chain acyl-[acyl-carrier-protein] hydrolase